MLDPIDPSQGKVRAAEANSPIMPTSSSDSVEPTTDSIEQETSSDSAFVEHQPNSDSVEQPSSTSVEEQQSEQQPWQDHVLPPAPQEVSQPMAANDQSGYSHTNGEASLVNGGFNNNQRYNDTNESTHNQQQDHYAARKNAVRLQLEEAFKILPERPSFDNLNQLKMLAKMVSRADDLLDPFWRDRELQIAMLDLLDSKLPQEKWEQFGAFIGDAPGQNTYRTMRNLKRFLIRQLKVAYENLRAEAEREEAEAVAARAENGGRGGGDDGSEELFCIYCKGTTHVVEKCIQIKYTLCFVCLEDGHTQRRCPVYNVQQQQPARVGGGWQ